MISRSPRLSSKNIKVVSFEDNCCGFKKKKIRLKEKVSLVDVSIVRTLTQKKFQEAASEKKPDVCHFTAATDRQPPF